LFFVVILVSKTLVLTTLRSSDNLLFFKIEKMKTQPSASKIARLLWQADTYLANVVHLEDNLELGSMRSIADARAAIIEAKLFVESLPKENKQPTVADPNAETIGILQAFANATPGPLEPDRVHVYLDALNLNPMTQVIYNRALFAHCYNHLMEGFLLLSKCRIKLDAFGKPLEGPDSDLANKVEKWINGVKTVKL